MRPLDRVGSIKLKLGLVIVGAVVVTVVVVSLGAARDWPVVATGVIAAVIALGVVQVLARGMTSPLRDMARQARRLAAGEDHRHVRATSADEVGELARAFNLMADELAASDRLRRDLVANVSHELRTPIAALQVVLENLVDGVDEPDGETLRSMLQQVERLSALVDQVLQLSRLEAGAVPLERTAVAVHDLVMQAAAASRLDAERVHLRAADGVNVEVDAERMQQVLVNLFDNADRHAPAGSPVDVHVHETDDAVTLTVSDRGPGIAPDEAERIFERFYRADGDRGASGGGSGLGLSIARWIVDLHGGDIRVDPTVTDGCHIVVRLPLRAGGAEGRLA